MAAKKPAMANSTMSTPMGKAFSAAEKSSSKLSAKQMKIATAAAPKAKITGADFKALKGKKKSKAPSMKKMQKEEDDEQTGY